MFDDGNASSPDKPVHPLVRARRVVDAVAHALADLRALEADIADDRQLLLVVHLAIGEISKVPSRAEAIADWIERGEAKARVAKQTKRPAMVRVAAATDVDRAHLAALVAWAAARAGRNQTPEQSAVMAIVVRAAEAHREAFEVESAARAAALEARGGATWHKAPPPDR